MPRILSYRASEADEGRRVRDIIRQEFRLVAHDSARAKYRTEKGITVNGETVMVSRPLAPGDLVEVRLDFEMPEHTVPSEGPLTVLYEDEDVLCVDKPAGMVVHPSHGHFADSLGNRIAAYFLRNGEPHEIRTVGRLDKDTSGVLVVAKSRTATAILTGQVGNEPCKKEYLALAAGTFSGKEGTVEAPISAEYIDKNRREVTEDGRYALTRYQVLEQYGGFALVKAEIETGRTHQIRVHMAHIGHPLLGDPIYGSAGNEAENAAPLTRAALHARRVSFRQPFTREPVTVTAEIPEDMRRVMEYGAAGRVL